jgi:hypothetical protein
MTFWWSATTVNSGTHIVLLVPLSMPPAVQQRIASDRASLAALTAGTHEPEPDAAQVQRDGLVIDRDADGLYGDGVECDTNIVGGLSGGREDRAPQAVTPAPAAEAAPLMSTDFPGQPFGRGDTITVIPSAEARRWIERMPANVPQEDAISREAERQAFLRRVQYVDPRERRV